ncbi:MAG TPA: hypothetical protein VMD99_12130 [Terriglobales bacterium]|nr:hypothetical protein [Terriglobales bacterium]
MRRNGEESENQKAAKQEVRMELKYCERCGGLWLRECGTGVVYCERCQRAVEDLPIPKRPQRVTLPTQQPSLIDDYEYENEADDDSLDFEATGGAA